MLSNSQYIIIFLSLIFFLISATSCTETGRTSGGSTTINEPMRVMSFNIRFDNPADGPDAWPHRKDFVASMFRFHKNDIVGTQEGLINQLRDLDEMLPEFDWVGIGRDDGGEAGEFCAIYYKSDRFDLVEDGTFWLSETPDVPGSMGWDTAITRIVTWARLYDKKNDRRFIVFNTHYDHRGQEARRNSSKLILQKVSELSGGDPVIVMGDLNAVESQDPYKILADPELGPVRVELFDGFYHSRYGHHGPTSTWNAFREIYPDRRIDYIFVDTNFSVIQHGILADIRDGHFPSDHLPVVADLEFKH
ncbi:MAG: endonuclease/exonuclease/phosphatase family protein [Balneolaceae bacterium]|nr:MAG: endonuclease/exonuclease/phosphatase family protein [Balneolaceae bacterium]